MLLQKTSYIKDKSEPAIYVRYMRSRLYTKLIRCSPYKLIMLQLRCFMFCAFELFARSTQYRTNVFGHCIIQYRKAIQKYDATVRSSCGVGTEIFRDCSLFSSRSFFLYCILFQYGGQTKGFFSCTGIVNNKSESSDEVNSLSGLFGGRYRFRFGFIRHFLHVFIFIKLRT